MIIYFQFRLQQVKIEHHKTCGNDKLFIIDGQKENGNGNGYWFNIDYDSLFMTHENIDIKPYGKVYLHVYAVIKAVVFIMDLLQINRQMESRLILNYFQNNLI